MNSDDKSTVLLALQVAADQYDEMAERCSQNKTNAARYAANLRDRAKRARDVAARLSK
jgi:hypothetical protein